MNEIICFEVQSIFQSPIKNQTKIYILNLITILRQDTSIASIIVGCSCVSYPSTFRADVFCSVGFSGALWSVDFPESKQATWVIFLALTFHSLCFQIINNRFPFHLVSNMTPYETGFTKIEIFFCLVSITIMF